MSHPDDREVREAFATSLAGRAVIATRDRVANAWRESAITAALRRGTGTLRQRPADERLRLCAATAAWTALFHLAARTWLPAYATSALPWWWNLAAAAAAVAVAANARTLAMAWPQSRAGRLWHWLADSDDPAVSQHRGL